jgi:hypothetical protein
VTPLFLSVICWKSGVPFEGEQEGESRPFRGRKGQVFPAGEPRKGHFGGIEAKKWRSHILKYLFQIKPKYYENIVIKTPETPVFLIGNYEEKTPFFGGNAWL